MCPLYHVSHMAVCSFQTSGRTSFSALNLSGFFRLWPLDLLLKGLTLLSQAHPHSRRWDYTGCVYQGLGILGTIFQFWLAQHIVRMSPGEVCYSVQRYHMYSKKINSWTEFLLCRPSLWLIGEQGIWGTNVGRAINTSRMIDNSVK